MHKKRSDQPPLLFGDVIKRSRSLTRAHTHAVTERPRGKWKQSKLCIRFGCSILNKYTELSEAREQVNRLAALLVGEPAQSSPVPMKPGPQPDLAVRASLLIASCNERCSVCRHSRNAAKEDPISEARACAPGVRHARKLHIRAASSG